MSDSVGQLQAIWRFPIKSFQGERLERAELSASGIHADRVLALRNRETGKIVSAKHAKLSERVLSFEARYATEPRLGEPLPPIRVRIGDREVGTDDLAAFSEVCSAALDHPVELVAPGSDPEVYESDWPEIEGLPLAGANLDLPLPLAEAGSFADLEPLHVLTTASLAHLASLAPESEIDVSRFRPSLLIDTGEASGFVEHDWTGRKATLGGATLELGAAAPRCLMTTRAQGALPRDPAVLKTLVQNNRREFMGMQMPCLGIYAKVIEPGPVAAGDPLVLA
ncbi:MAG: MOSC domain-containing protein [Myxococcota bacterium]|nr:MOSC domain-containing protein [Myxococcota bacterium]